MLDKTRMMEHYDELVTDARLKRDELRPESRGWSRTSSAGVPGDDPASGSSGRKGLFVYERAGLADHRRRVAPTRGWGSGETPETLPDVPHGGRGPLTHDPAGLRHPLRIGIHRFLGLPLTLPIERMVAELNRFQPEFLNVYPSIAMRLAEEQLAGRLRLSLTMMSTSRELRTPEM